MINLSDLTKLLKMYAINSSISDEEFLNAFLNPLIMAGNITNKNGDEFYLNKNRTSEIMNHKADVPAKLRNALSFYGIKENTIKEMDLFLADYIDPGKKTDLLGKLQEMMKEMPDITAIIDNNVQLPAILTELLFSAVKSCNLPNPETVLIWKCGCNSIDVQSGDLFHFGFDNRHKKNNIVVIPVNTAFDTVITRRFEGEGYPLVSENTVHGQWLIRMIESGESRDQLDIRISESLKKTGFNPLKQATTENGKKQCYKTGAVAMIETKNAVYFLVALSEFNGHNNAKTSSDDIDSAIGSLLDVYDRFGQGYDLYLPLMGTGLSRAGLSIQQAYDLEINSLLKNKNSIHGNVHVILRPEDRKELHEPKGVN